MQSPPAQAWYVRPSTHVSYDVIAEGYLKDVRLAVVVTLDMLTECLLFGLAVFFFRNLQMPIGKKMQVLAGFGLRLG